MTPDPDRLRESLVLDWTQERQEAGLRRLQASPSRKNSLRWTVPLVAAAAVVAAFFIGRNSLPPSAAEHPTTVAGPGDPAAVVIVPRQEADVRPPSDPPTPPAIVPLQFRDGSSVTPHNAVSDVVIADASDARVRLQLRRGGARFDVTPNPDRNFAVEAGPVTVEVLGTEFDCNRDGDQVTVEVIRGSVSVAWDGGSTILKTGQSGTFPPQAPLIENPEPEPGRPPATQKEWRRLAKRGDQKKAYDALLAGGKVANRAEELMLAADVARRAGHTPAALPYLQRVLEHHPKDSRAPLAAFTIGRIELRRGNYKTAAGSFLRVRELGGTSLAEHALAREVEAWVGANNNAKARRRAQEYLRLYPDGPRVEQVRARAGIDGG